MRCQMKKWKTKQIEQRDLERLIDSYDFENILQFAAHLTANKKHQKVFHLRYANKMTFYEIADILGVTPPACQATYKHLLEDAEAWRYLKFKQDFYYETGCVRLVHIGLLPVKKIFLNTCQILGIELLSDLAKITAEDILKVRGAGLECVNEARKFMAMFGLAFSNEKAPEIFPCENWTKAI